MAKTTGLTREPDWEKGLYLRDGIYQYRRQYKGKRRITSLETSKFSRAESLASDLNHWLDHEKVSLDTAMHKVGIPGASVSFADAASKYIASRPIRPSTKKRYDGVVANILRVGRELTGRPELRMEDFTSDFVSKYLQRRKTEPVARNGHKNSRKTVGAKAKTIQNEMVLARSILKYAKRMGWLTEIPFLPLSEIIGRAQKDAAAIARPLTDDEMPKVLAAAKEYDASREVKDPYTTYFHDLILTFIYAGLRHEEAQMLEWSNIRFEENLIRVRRKKVTSTRKLPLTAKAIEQVIPFLSGKKKSGKVFPDDPEVLHRVGSALRFKSDSLLRKLTVGNFSIEEGYFLSKEHFEWFPKAQEGDVVLHPRLKKVLLKLKSKSPSNFVFPDKDGGYWRMHFDRHLGKVINSAGIADTIRVHDLRHTTGAMLRRRGVALETIKEILRHKDIKDTLIYARYEHSEGMSAIKKLPDWE